MDRPKLRRPERLRSRNTLRLSLGENMFMDSRVSRWSSVSRLTVEPGTNTACHRPIAHKVKPDQVEAYKEAALVPRCVSHRCE